MTETELDGLLRRMATDEPAVNSEDSISWRAYREAERLSDARLLDPLLVRLPGAKTDLRIAVYFAISHLGRNTRSMAVAEALVGQLSRERNGLCLQFLLDDLLRLPRIPQAELIAPFAEDRRACVRESAIATLGHCPGGISEAALVQALRSRKDSRTVICAMRALRTVGTAQSASDVARFAADAVCEVRLTAIWALEALGGPELTPLFIAALGDRVANVKYNAMRAIRRCGDARAVEAVCRRVAYLLSHPPKIGMYGETEIVIGLSYLDRHRASNMAAQDLFDAIATQKWNRLNDEEKAYLRRDIAFFGECPPPMPPVEIPERESWVEAEWTLRNRLARNDDGGHPE
ncbi:MAG TPA: HEAT repeat domain-containing protein [Armatimonadota bacterium]|jgi:hypothetical protein